MTPDLYFAVPGELTTLTGGFIYDRQVIAALWDGGVPVRPLIWPSSFPLPSSADRAAAAASLSALPAGSVVLVDGLAFGALPDLMTAEAERLRLIALVHHPLGYETGWPTDIRNRLIESERQALAAARHIITTSRTTALTLEDEFGVHPKRMTVACPGAGPPMPRQVRPPHSPPLLLSVGAATPRKAHDLLVQALARIADLSWSCVIAGSLQRDETAAARLRAAVVASGLENRIRLAGEVTDVRPLYAMADLFVLASHYEGYGMAFAEALQQGLPAIGTTGGAIPEVVPADAGLLVPPGNVSALAAALRRLLTDAPLRQALVAGARRAAAAQPGWRETANIIAGVVRACMAGENGYAKTRSNNTSVPS